MYMKFLACTLMIGYTLMINFVLIGIFYVAKIIKN